MKILVGTTNKGKQKDYKQLVGSIFTPPVNIVFPQDLNITDEPEETGTTFQENSLLKAQFYYKKSGIPTIADDGGLEIPVLNNEPGVYSRRWPGYSASDEELIAHTLEKLKSYQTRASRKAYLTVCLTFFDGICMIQEIEKIEGYIAHRSNTKYSKGYPYRALFVIRSLNKYYDQLTQEEHEKLNHRHEALVKLWKRLLPSH